MRTVSIRVPIKIFNQIETLAEKDGRNITNFLVRIITQFIEKQEKPNDHTN